MVQGNIFLVGPMGAGKSSVGRQLSKSLGLQFFDSDKEIEKRTGVSISWIFEMEGEAGFRAREKKVIDELTQKKNIVLATGGGVILDSDNRACLRSRGYVIYLSASVEQLLKRTSKDKKRPLLQTADPKAQIEKLLDERDCLYKDIADMELRTGDQSIQYVVSGLIRKLKKSDKLKL